MDPAAIKSTYDFMESEIFGVFWFNMFRSLAIGLNYFWDIGVDYPGKAGPTQLMLLQLRGCIWANFRNQQELVETNFAYHTNVASVVGWDIDLDVPQELIGRRLGQQRLDGYRYAYVATDVIGPYQDWLEAVYRDVDVVHLSPRTPGPPR